MILGEADHRFCHQEEKQLLPSPFRPQVAPRRGSLYPHQVTGVVPQSRPGTECLPRGLMWAQNPITFPLQYQIHQDLFSRIFTTGDPQQGREPPDPRFPETEVLLLEPALCARIPRAPPLRSPGLLCPRLQAEPWMTSPLHHLLPWATGPPSTEKPFHLLPHRTTNLQCLPPHGLGPGHRHHLLRHHPAGPALLPCLLLPMMRSRGCHSGTCPSHPQHRPCLHLDALGLSLPHPMRGPLLQ